MSGLTGAQVVSKKLSGERPQWPAPDQYPVEELFLYDWIFVRECWEAQPTSRPTMGRLFEQAHHAYVSTSERILNLSSELGDQSLDDTGEMLRGMNDDTDLLLPEEEENDAVDLLNALGLSGRGDKTASGNKTSTFGPIYSEGKTHSDPSLGMVGQPMPEDLNRSIIGSWTSQESVGLRSYDHRGTLVRETSESSMLRAAYKVIELLGPDTPQRYLAKVAAAAKPSYLRPNYDWSDIQFNTDGSVRAGTTTALVEWLTSHEQTGKLDTKISLPVVDHEPFGVLYPL